MSRHAHGSEVGHDPLPKSLRPVQQYPRDVRRWAILVLGVLLLCTGVQSASAEILFWPARLDFPVGSPRHIAIGDLNGDQVMDLAAVSGGSHHVAVRLGLGDGTFGPASFYVEGGPFSYATCIAIGDVDGDQVPDLAVTIGVGFGDRTGSVAILLGLGDGTFGPESFYDVGGGPESVAIGDLDGDQVPDLAVVNVHDVAVLLGIGDGSFSPASYYDAGDRPISVAIGDLDGDHIPDLAVANGSADTQDPGDVAVLLGLGDGSFAQARFYRAGAAPSCIAIGDLDGDHTPDLAVANEGSDNIAVLLGLGDGSFSEASFYRAGDGPCSVAIGDLDGDHVLDLAVASRGVPWDPGDVAVLLGLGDGSFGPASSYGAGVEPRCVAIGNLDDDQIPDLAVAAADVCVFLGLGDGSFAQASPYQTGTAPWSVAISDLDGDQILDLAVANKNSDNIAVLLGLGDGSFGAASFYGTVDGPNFIAVGDLDGDQVPDLALTSMFAVAVLLGQGDGSFGPATFYGTGAGREPESLAIGDLDGDQVPDLAVACLFDYVAVLPGQGDGSFGQASVYPAGDRPKAVAISDLDGDQVPDLAVANRGTSSNPGGAAVLLGLGDGSFGAPSFYEAGYGPRSIATGDLDGDQVPDLAVASAGGLAVLLGLGDGSFGPASFCGSGVEPRSIAIGDLDGDHVPDLAAANSNNAAVLLGLGDGSFGPASFYGTGIGPRSIAIGDLDSDQDLDLAVANGGPDSGQNGNTVSVLLGTGGGPVPVVLSWFEVVASETAVTVAWETSFEANHLGFHVYRAEAGRDHFERLSDDLIRGAGEGGRRYEFIDRSVVAGETYTYRLVAVDVRGGTQTFGLGSVTAGRVLPAALVLHQNHPNPFNPSTSIAFDLPGAAEVTLRVYDLRGRLVRTLVDGRLARSFHTIEWDGRDDLGRPLGSGVYYCRLEAGAAAASRKMVMLDRSAR